MVALCARQLAGNLFIFEDTDRQEMTRLEAQARSARETQRSAQTALAEAALAELRDGHAEAIEAQIAHHRDTEEEFSKAKQIAEQLGADAAAMEARWAELRGKWGAAPAPAEDTQPAEA